MTSSLNSTVALPLSCDRPIRSRLSVAQHTCSRSRARCKKSQFWRVAGLNSTWSQAGTLHDASGEWRIFMARFSKGARVLFVEEKTTGRIGTVLEVLPRTERAGSFDRYRVEFPGGEVKTLSDLELAPAGADPTIETVA